MPAKNKKPAKLKSKRINAFKNRPLIFVLVFAVLGAGLILISSADTTGSNPAHDTYSVKLPPADCIKTKSGACSPIQGTEGLKLYGPSNKSARYVLKNVGPGRYNMDISYSIPQVIGVYDYGHIKYSVSGRLVNIGQPLSGSRHIILYGNSPSTSTQPLTATGTFTSVGVKYPKSDVQIKVGYSNKYKTTLRITSIILRPQKSRSGWTCNNPGEPCKPSSDYKYYFASGKAPSPQAVSSSSGASSSSPANASGSSRSSSSGDDSSNSRPKPKKHHAAKKHESKTTFKKNGSASTSPSNASDAVSADEADECSQGNIFSQAFCHIRSGIDSLFSHV